GIFLERMMDLHVDVLLVDVLAPEAIDLFDDRSYKLLLRVSRRLADCRTGGALVDPLLSAAEVDTLRQITSDWMVQQGGGGDWSVPDGQPYCLHALAAFGAVVSDKDVALWPALLRGVPTGLDNGIPASNVFAPRCVPPSDEDLQICFGNWGGAEAEPALLADLVQKELAAGYIEEVSSLADAQ
ncbi:unnamed protein product, partial [Effrenium voratum]